MCIHKNVLFMHFVFNSKAPSVCGFFLADFDAKLKLANLSDFLKIDIFEVFSV